MSPQKVRRVLLLVLCLVTFLVLVVVFRSFFMNNIVRPVTLVLWAVWRLISSVNQKIYWGVVIALCLYFAIRLIPTEIRQLESEAEARQPRVVNGYASWLSVISSAMAGQAELEHLRQRLSDLSISVIAQKKKVSPEEAEELLRSKQLPIPEAGRAFLYPEARLLKYRFHALLLRGIFLWNASRRRKRSRMPGLIEKPVGEILDLMENQAEMNHEN